MRGASGDHRADDLLTGCIRSETLHNCYYRDFVGDVTAYSADNPKDELNHVRAEILYGCANRIRALLEDRTAGVASYEARARRQPLARHRRGLC